MKPTLLKYDLLPEAFSIKPPLILYFSSQHSKYISWYNFGECTCLLEFKLHEGRGFAASSWAKTVSNKKVDTEKILAE